MGPSVAVAALLILLGIVSLVTAAKPRHTWAPKTPLNHSCSRGLSRTVRQKFQGQVGRKLKGVQRPEWPVGCPFSPYVDVFGWHEKNKSRSKSARQSSEWECNYTGKSFKSEHYIDLHMENHFAQVMPVNGTCLADYCEVFGFCNVKEPGFFESLASEPPPCDPNLLEAQKKTCHSVIDRCVIPDDPVMPHMSTYLHGQLCEPLTCELIAEKHHSNRKLGIMGLVFVCVFAMCIFLCCVFGPAQEPQQRSYYGKNDRYRTGQKQKRSSGKSDESEIVDIIPTKSSAAGKVMPTKPIKQA